GLGRSGTGGGSFIAPGLGGLAVLSFGGLVGRLAGRQWAPAGALALALTLPQLYTSRDAFSETAVQVLLFGGLSLLVDALTMGPGRLRSLLPAAVQPIVPAADTAAESSPGASDESATADTTELPAIGSAAAESATAESSATQPSTTESPTTAFSTAEFSAGRLGTTEAGGPGAAVPPEVLAVRSTFQTRLWSWLLATPWLLTRITGSLTPDLRLAAVGGLALGLTSLLSLASLPYLIPAVLVTGILLAARRASGVLFGIGICVGVG